MSSKRVVREKLTYARACEIAAFVVGYQCGARWADDALDKEEAIARCLSEFRVHGPLYCRVSLTCFTTWYNWCSMQGYGAASMISINGVERLV